MHPGSDRDAGPCDRELYSSSMLVVYDEDRKDTQAVRAEGMTTWQTTSHLHSPSPTHNIVRIGRYPAHSAHE